ncbi:hypothetical protein CHS0354_017436 [Potamilus streckersoni]|uniref:Uncharacterized protein n=1 Tax=Potamilus streckersoni TaxID=2493646 RepID=A0AAE0VT54_9BIVA|nr:hypothetical protein CHS0354_017436 [Potamilus streckersoni]
MQKMSRVDPKPILRTFLQDLQNKLPSICGQPLRLVSKAKIATLEVYQSNQTEQTVPNLASRIQIPKNLYRGKEEMERLFSRTQFTSENYPVSRASTSFASTGYIATQMEQNAFHSQNMTSHNSIQSSSNVIMDKNSLFTPGGLSKLFRPDSVGTILHNEVEKDTIFGVQDQRVPDQAMQNKPRIIPVFKPLKLAQRTPAINNIIPSTSTGPRIVPVFTAKTVITAGALQKLQSTSNLVQRKSVFSGHRDDVKQNNSFISNSDQKQKQLTKRKSTTKEARSNPSKLKKPRTKGNAVIEE